MIPSGSIFRVQVLGVPVEVGMTAVVLVGFLALSAGRAGTQGLIAGAAYAVVLLGSILVHELGHAIVGGRLGLRPKRIVLHGFGGFCEYGRSPKPAEGVISSLAGPGAGLLLGGLLLGLRLALGGSLPDHVLSLLDSAVFINIFWSLFNLLPMFPLDGGQVLWHGLRLRLPPAQADKITRGVAVPVAILAGIAGYAAGFIFIPLICFFALMRALRM